MPSYFRQRRYSCRAFTFTISFYKNLNCYLSDCNRIRTHNYLVRKRTLNYESYLDQTYVNSLIDTLLFCCFSICSDYTLFYLEIENLREILKKSSYPSGIMEQCIKSLLDKLHVSKKVIPTVPKKEIFIVFPYLGTMPSNLGQRLRTFSKNSLPLCNIKKILKLTNCLSSLFCFKDVILTLLLT